MRIPFDAIISPEKLTDYLLIERPWDDKSKFLAQADFTLENPLALDFAIRQLGTGSDAQEDGSNEYGTFYRVTGELIGPTGLPLPVVLVWLQWKSDGLFHFVTLKPHKSQS
ncbi:MAG: hypothetical protein SH868_09845 [Bythopirellula sp.]|nr:hypothetical protein [Bythopirellula sp.]